MFGKCQYTKNFIYFCKRYILFGNVMSFIVIDTITEQACTNEKYIPAVILSETYSRIFKIDSIFRATACTSLFFTYWLYLYGWLSH